MKVDVRALDATGTPSSTTFLRGDGEWVTVVSGDGPSILDYGAVVDGVTDDSAAVIAMMNDVGYVVFPAGGTAIGTNITVTEPLFYSPGAWTTVDTGVTFTIQASVESGKQYIFRGDGDYAFNLEGWGNGAESRRTHVSWWGLFPGNPDGDIGPTLQRITDSMDNTREAWVEFDVGEYFQVTPVVWNRCTRVYGMGDRMTNIFCPDTGNMWQTAGQGCKFTNLQFTTKSLGPRVDSYIYITQTRCIVENVVFNFGFLGVTVAAGANWCEIRDITGHNPWASFEGGHLVLINGASGCIVERVTFSPNTGSPNYVVRLDARAQHAHNNTIREITNNAPGGGCVIVRIAGAFTIAGTIIENIRQIGAGTQAVYVQHAGTGNSQTLLISNVNVQAGETAVLVELSSSGNIQGLTINNVVARLATNAGIRITNSSTGIVEGLAIGTHSIRTNGTGTVGVFIGGTGSVHDGVSIGPGICYMCPTGYDLLATRLVGAGLAATEGGTGFNLRSGLVNWAIQGLANANSTANKTDSSGSVTKQDNILST